MIDILQFLAGWTLVGLGAAIGFGIMTHRMNQEDREREREEEAWENYKRGRS